MGGDFGTRVVIPAAKKILSKYQDINLILVGDSYIINKQLARHNLASSKRLQVQHASQKVAMHESPVQALRTKKDSSMRVAINLVKSGGAHACVSAGNTGALLATASFVLKTLPGVDRPAIIRTLPTLIPDKNVRMLDLGANVDSSPHQLLQFAVMGRVLAEAVDNIQNPSVRLLNIGEEDIKGNELVKQAAMLFKDNDAIHYVGYIEGDKIYHGTADVIVCDGFVGNIALKVTEGTVNTVLQFVKQAFLQNWLSKVAGLLVKPIFSKIRKKIDPDYYNGASLIGLQGIVIKSHGGASANGFARAIEEAMHEVGKNVPSLIREQVAQLLKQTVE
jgi:glycerol-3-phosphate acyltransferase PlsX